MIGFYMSGWLARAKRRARRMNQGEWIWLGLFLFHLVLSSIFTVQGDGMPDEGAYVNLATNIAERGSFEADYALFNAPKNVPMTHYSPVWPAMLALPWALGLGEHGLFFVLGLVWCFNVWLISKCAEELGVSRRFRWLAIGWLTLNPIYLYYHAHLMTEPLTVGLGLALVLTGFRFLHNPWWNTMGPFALVSGIAHLTRGQLVLVSGAVWIAFICTRPPKIWGRYVLAFAAVHLLVISPWLLRMSAVGAGGFFPERKLGFNLYLFNHPDVKNPYALQPDEAVRFPDGLETMTPRDRDETLVKLALDGIREHKLLYFKRCTYRLGYLLSPFAAFTRVSTWRDWCLAAATVLFFYSLWLAVFVEGVRVGRWRHEEAALLVAIALWYVFHALVNGSIRNRIPSDAWLALLAASLFSRRIPKETVEI